jgi:chromosome segregation protein
MYLKSIEMIGFKSFAGKTKLEFEPGMTSIVGPNGCGKSNIADAVRWVLGEQSAKALRGSKMQDVIFGGTDLKKPMGLAEVSLTLAECEESLGTEYNEVTVTRRVLRSGEGQYFVNRTPCRLKDIQRLFMDTGIGTTSYSMMEQGKIDQILSSRPDDRRAVFEEASGITKYKADKKEALRKLDHTEANLIRLDDIIREVRRQIISLQRQAGKARRYTTMRDTLRGFDIFHTRERLQELETEIKNAENRLSSVHERDEAVREETADLENTATEAREEVAAKEREIGEVMDAVSRARSELERCRELIRVNEDRVREIRTLSERDTKDAEEATVRCEEHQARLAEFKQNAESAGKDRDAAEEKFSKTGAQLKHLESEVEQTGHQVHRLRTDMVESESRGAKLQNELTDLEAAERTTVVRRERLSAEQAELKRAADQFGRRQSTMTERHDELLALSTGKAEALAAAEEALRQSDETCARIRQEIAELRSDAAARQARIDLLEESAASGDGFPGGARYLLDEKSTLPAASDKIMGSLAEHIRASKPFERALEAVLRAWLDAVIVSDEKAALALVREISGTRQGSVRLLPLRTVAHRESPSPAGKGRQLLLEHVDCTPEARPLVERLLGNVIVMGDSEQIPETVEGDATFVTRDGVVKRGDGSVEYWMREDQDSNPLGIRQNLESWQQEQSDLSEKISRSESELRTIETEIEACKEKIEAARRDLEGARRDVAICEGENQVVEAEAKQARERLDTVTYELEALNEQDSSTELRRTEILQSLQQLRTQQEETRGTIAEQTQGLRALEQERGELYNHVTEHRVQFAECRQRVEHLESQCETQTARIHELETLIRERRAGLDSYQARIDELTRAAEEAQSNLAPLDEQSSDLEQKLETVRRERSEKIVAIEKTDAELREKRNYLEALMNQRNELDVELAEQRMRRQNQIERIGSEYDIGVEQVMEESEPEWEGEARPDPETLETMIGELRTKLDAMGPVNLVAIEEHRELEERYAFLTTQQEDLVNAKQQLMDMIRHINKTTTEMFSATFNQVNENFQEMFKKLFGGGTAKLVLVDEEDVLESGIEIIARPPGKKLQTVSLLSGGERTMTAVALLFALYLEKPSAFCLLDELDAPLDEANIGRFVQTVKGFLERSQFIVITHNQKTIAASDILYGITMQERGVSSIVSVKFSDFEAAGGIPKESTGVPQPQP